MLAFKLICSNFFLKSGLDEEFDQADRDVLISENPGDFTGSHSQTIANATN